MRSRFGFHTTCPAFAMIGLIAVSALLPAVKANAVEEWKLLLSSETGFIDVAAGDGIVVALENGRDNGRIISWPHGDPTNRSIFPVAGRLNSIAHGLRRFVAGTDRALLTSSNGVDWTSQPFAGDLTTTVEYGNRMFLAKGSRVVLRSTDGVNWTPVAAPITNSPMALRYFAGNFVLWTTGGVSFVSRDGLAWSSPPPGFQLVSTIAQGDGMYVAINLQNELITSRSGTDWTAHGKFDVLRPHLAYGNGYFVAVGGSARAYSRDGISWKVTKTAVTSYNLIFAYGTFIAGGYLGVYSTEGVATLELNRFGKVYVRGVPGRTYRVESADQFLTGGASWNARHTFVMPPLAVIYLWNGEPATERSRFYRVVQASE